MKMPLISDEEEPVSKAIPDNSQKSNVPRLTAEEVLGPDLVSRINQVIDSLPVENDEASSESSVEPDYTVREVEYYDDTWDTNNFVVCINGQHFFVADPTSGPPQWKFVNRYSGSWSGLHWRIYGGFRADKIERAALPPRLPPPPDSIPPEAFDPPPPAQPKEVTLAKYFPGVLVYFTELWVESLPMFLVLREDLYESKLGDGEVHYAHSVFFDEANAKQFIEQNRSEQEEFFLRPVTLELRDGVLDCPDIELQNCDSFSAFDVVRLMEDKIEKNFDKAHPGLRP